MATSSFYTVMKIETEEQVQAILRAFEEAEKRPPEEPMSPSIDEQLEEGKRLLREGFLDHLLYGNKSE